MADWLKLALAAACGLLAGVVLASALGAGDGGKRRTVTVARTITVPAPVSAGGTVIVTTAVPDLVGQPLDVARDRLERARFDPDVRGGGALGILREGNWEVVAQRPAPGTQLEQGSSVRLDVVRR